MDGPRRELERPAIVNELGWRVLALAERSLGPRGLARLRRILWRGRIYLYVTPGPLLVRQALAPFPDEVRALGERCPFHRYDARSGGGYWPEPNEIWLAAGVETYEGLGQVVLSARHEVFHFIAHNDPVYRADEERGWAALWSALRESAPISAMYPRYRSWMLGSFLPQGDHANPTELFADIPTNFPDPRDIPPPLRTYFAPRIEGAEGGPQAAPTPPSADLAAFHRLLASEG